MIKVAINDTGIVNTGINVVRNFCKNTYVTSTTNKNVTTSVSAILSIEALTYEVESYATPKFISSGKCCDKAFISFFIFFIISKEFEFGV